MVYCQNTVKHKNVQKIEFDVRKEGLKHNTHSSLMDTEKNESV